MLTIDRISFIRYYIGVKNDTSIATECNNIIQVLIYYADTAIVNFQTCIIQLIEYNINNVCYNTCMCIRV
jgi:hypothetical protein